MRFSHVLITAMLSSLLLVSGCQNKIFQSKADPVQTLKDYPAVRFNFKFEPDVPPPTVSAPAAEEKNAAIQADFDSFRTMELLDRTIQSPDKQRVVAVYHHISDIPSEFRLDMYAADGKLLKKITSETMAVHFPDTIVWSPDSTTLAFVAMIRAGKLDPTAAATPPNSDSNTAPVKEAEPVGNDNTVIDATNVEAATPTSAPAPTIAPPTGILTFRTEQIYTCGANGDGTKPLTENEGLIYFYYAWAPDSSMLVALAATAREWRYLEIIADSKGEIMVPQGRPRIIEKNGRERRLDDNQTSVHPVWSPDSAKVADAYDTQIRIYDAAGTNPTQAAIPLRNQLLISSQAYDQAQQRSQQGSNANTDANAAPSPSPDQPLSTLPDGRDLVSFNPIIELEWTADNLLYLRTAFVKRMKNQIENAVSFARWHRLAFSPQVEQTPK